MKRQIHCRFCGEAGPPEKERDSFSHWTHSHPSICPHRQDRMPSLNGVHVGDVWENLHTKHRITISAIRLGGAGVYTDREPIVVDEDDDMMGGWPLWSLVEHWKPITRPGSYPVPWHYDKRFGKGSRSANDAWRCPGHRGHDRERRSKYWHSYLRADGHVTVGWGDHWQVDDAQVQREAALKNLPDLIAQHPEIAAVAERLQEALKEAA